MEQGQLLAHCGTNKLTREELQLIPTPEATDTYRPLAHFDIVQALLETLAFRHISTVRDEYAVSPDGMKMFGVLDLETTFEGCRFSIGIRNSNDKSMRLAMTVGYRVFVCDNMAFQGDFTPVLAKHTKKFSLIDAVSVGVDRMQRNFAPMQQQVECWRKSQIADDKAKLVIYRSGTPRMHTPLGIQRVTFFILLESLSYLLEISIMLRCLNLNKCLAGSFSSCLMEFRTFYLKFACRANPPSLR